MYCIRPIEERDLEAFTELAFEGEVGMTNLPKVKKLLKQLLDKAVSSFKLPFHEINDQLYLFILEELSSSEVLGVSAIFAQTYNLDYFLKKELNLPAIYPEVPISCPILEHVNYAIGPSEIGALFVKRAARQSGAGKLLSLSRFLFMRAFPERFTSTVFAELRGVIDPDGNSLFWKGVGSQFLPITFKELMHRRSLNPIEVAKLIPQYPLYIPLLPQEVQSVIGEPHPDSQPALHMLHSQGFKPTGEIDPYDGGPRLAAEREKIKAISQARQGKVQSIIPSINGTSHLISNLNLAFRAVIASLEIDQHSLTIDQATAHALQASEGDTLLLVNLK